MNKCVDLILQVELFFAGSVSGEVPFTVHPNGSITVSRALDRETDPIYGFTVLARDRGNIPLSNTTHVREVFAKFDMR